MEGAREREEDNNEVRPLGWSLDIQPAGYRISSNIDARFIILPASFFLRFSLIQPFNVSLSQLSFAHAHNMQGRVESSSAGDEGALAVVGDGRGILRQHEPGGQGVFGGAVGVSIRTVHPNE